MIFLNEVVHYLEHIDEQNPYIVSKEPCDRGK